MENKDILEGNRLIGEFMGYRMFDKKYPRNHGIGAPEAEWKDMIVEKAKFHASWNRLMPVVEKIEATYDDFNGYFGVHISSNSCTIQGTKLRTDPENFHPAYLSDPNAIFPTKIESTWYNIVQFIKWYNTQTLE